ncbi:hypothetical protein NNA68_00435 [Cutibacterium acnes]|jgi:hypothetical protein|uniref:hypothetical protein n=1 Tax=Cutibacterium TaxID=1912216 RepID=UPI0001C19FB0|nr:MULTISPECIES: hypothetical protein [Cutibacterium]AER05467.1 hypothetical protein TIIST44_04840 [Cutibacterium acnes subsp. defendens ATCC 11828]ALD68822.1 hypothetical protein RN83_00635 [Cutibacterium acnes]ALU22629.1 hypothetical protein VO62_00200 [Cutibacterium acnes]EFB87919.1 hypothetical protein HMPREF9206_0994 [Cutibacterium acnes J139]EFT27048.1 hypothetical protein HMPREF9577_00405 [Cutibacterium acnes HL110PA3]
MTKEVAMKHINTVASVVLPMIAGIPSLVEKRDERGLSQSTENAILLVGAVSIATVVVTVIKGYVSSNLPK